MNASVDVLAILHGGPSGGAENRLYTAEFFAACARALAPGGVLVLDLPGTANVAAPEAARMRGSIASALRREFHDVRIAPGDPHYLFAALPRARAARDEIRPLTWDPDTLAVRRHRLWPSARAWPAAAFARLFPRDRVNELRAELEREVGATERANEDLHPSVYYEELVRWDRLSGSGLAKLLGTWRSRPGLMSGLLLGFFFAGAVFVSRRSGQAYVSLATTGMAGMAIDILLLFLFQTLAGTLYLRIGLVVALFMIGLAAGSLIGARAKRLSIAATDWLWVGALGASLPLLHLMSGVSSRAASAVILPLAFAFGLLTALPFPRVAERLRGTDAHAAAAARAGGLADAADHAGALCGALLAGTLLIPLLGFANTLLFLAAVKACAVLGWRIRARGPTPARARA
jgi:spermidine synthase